MSGDDAAASSSSYIILYNICLQGGREGNTIKQQSMHMRGRYDNSSLAETIKSSFLSLSLAVCGYTGPDDDDAGSGRVCG